MWAAAAWAVASETPRMALAPSLLLFSVPSSSIIRRSKAGLIQGVDAGQFVGQNVVDVVDRLQHALAQVKRLVAVAQFQGLVNAGARAAGNRRPAERTVGQFHVDLNRRISAAIENLSGMDIENLRIHGTLLKRRTGSKSTSFSPMWTALASGGFLECGDSSPLSLQRSGFRLLAKSLGNRGVRGRSSTTEKPAINCRPRKAASANAIAGISWLLARILHSCLFVKTREFHPATEFRRLLSSLNQSCPGAIMEASGKNMETGAGRSPRALRGFPIPRIHIADSIPRHWVRRLSTR